MASTSFTSSLSKEKLLKTAAEDEFMKSVSTDQVTPEQFYAWLAQDHIVGICYFRLVAQAIIVAPPKDYSYFTDTLTAMMAELTWSEKKLKEKGINFEEIKPEGHYTAYQVWIDELIKSNPTCLSVNTALYAHDLCCYEKWKLVKTRDYREFAGRWSSGEFARAIAEIRTSIDKAAGSYSEGEKQEARKVWDTIIDFRAGA